MIKALVISDYVRGLNKDGTPLLVFDNIEKQLSSSLIDIASEQIIKLGHLGVDNQNIEQTKFVPGISRSGYNWLLFASVVLSYSTPDSVCQELDSKCVGYTLHDNFSDAESELKLTK